ncbi:alanine racemase [Pirellulaceae bacterium SH501]
MDWSLQNIPADQPTPSIIVSTEIVEQNLKRMQDYCNAHGLKLRPHTKTHKSLWAAQLQMKAGAVGLTVAKVGEAEVMSHVSRDIFIAYPAIGQHRMSRLMALAKRISVSVGIDSVAAAQQLQFAAKTEGVEIGVLVDIDVGFHRTGIHDANKAIGVAEFVASQSQLKFQGVMCFPGHILPKADDQAWESYQRSLSQIIETLQQKGISVGIVSGGSTPTAMESHRNRVLNEIRPGTYIYNDLNEVRLGVCDLEQVAARVLATVVSRPEPNKVVVDAGSKTLSSDRNAALPDSGFGYLPDFPDAKVVRLSEEHGEILFSESDANAGRVPEVGDRVWLIPNHICVCINLQNQFYLHDGHSLSVLPVDARGLLV